MKMLAATSGLFAVFALSGCATNPLPEDVTGIGTPDIVRQIRCEARDAAIEALVNFLRDRARDYPGRPGDASTLSLAERYRANPNAIAEFRPSLLKSPADQLAIKLLYSIGVAYSFELTMTEENNLSAGAVNARSGAAASLFALGVGGAFTRKRDNKRSFTITDTFDFLLRVMNQQVNAGGYRYCDQVIVRENHVYPISGRIGIRNIVYDFLDLTVFNNLGGKDKGPPSLSDTLTFTTVLDASVSPKITFLPTGTSFQVTDAGFTAAAKRTDAHQVVLGIALPPGPNEDLVSLRSYFFSAPAASVRTRSEERVSSTRSLVVGDRVIGGGSPAELLALAAVDQQRRAQIQFSPAP